MADEAEREMTLGELKAHIDQRIAEEGVKTRRHFDIVAESFKEQFRLFGERGDADHQRIEDHENRIRALENRRR
jgi:hypothetical protein